MASLKETDVTETGKILASGGLSTGMDCSKALILGAVLTGMALPFIREVTGGGEEAAIKYIRRLEKVLRTVMVLTGSKNLFDLKRAKVWLDHHFYRSLRSFQTTVDQQLITPFR
jgi:isopentenyl-diphosphate delta-isomerase